MSINLSQEDYERLQKYAAEQGKSVEDFLRDAIALEKYAGEVEKSGGKMLVEKDGKFKALQVA